MAFNRFDPRQLRDLERAISRRLLGVEVSAQGVGEHQDKVKIEVTEAVVNPCASAVVYVSVGVFESYSNDVIAEGVLRIIRSQLPHVRMVQQLVEAYKNG